MSIENDPPEGMTHGEPPLPPSLAGRDLVVFDGVCVLCSGFARLVARADTAGRFRFATAQSPLGTALFRHYGLAVDVYETNLVIVGGVGHQRMDGFIAAMRALGWPWRAFVVLKLLPQPVRDWLYRRVALNRYALFGKRETCGIPSSDLRNRLVG